MATAPPSEIALFLMGTYMVISLLLHSNLFEPKHMRGRAVLITDSTSKLGYQVALKYAQMNAKIFLTGDDEVRLNDLRTEFLKSGADEVAYLPGSVKENIGQLIPTVERRFGRLDHMLINHKPDFLPYDVMWNDEESLRRILDEWFMDTVTLTLHGVSTLKRSRGNLGVVLPLPGKISLPRSAAFCATNAALNAFLASLRQELKLSNESYVSVTSITLDYVKDDEDVNQLKQLGWWKRFFEPCGKVKIEDAAWWTLYYIGGRKKEVTYPFVAQCHSWLHNWFPTIYERPPQIPNIKNFITNISI